MGRSGYTSKPCHGCGQNTLHPKDALCTTCRDLLAGARVRQADAATRDGAFALYVMPATPRDTRAVGVRVVPRDAREALSQALGTLLLALTDRPDLADIQWPWADDPEGRELALGSHAARTMRPVTPAQAAAIRALYRALDVALDAAYAGGLARGTNLLEGLASGRLTMEQFVEGSRFRPFHGL